MSLFEIQFFFIKFIGLDINQYVSLFFFCKTYRVAFEIKLKKRVNNNFVFALKSIDKMGSNENIFASMLTDINYSNFLEAIVNGVTFVTQTPLEVETQGKSKITIKRKQSNKSIVAEQLTNEVKKEICVDKSTLSQPINHISEDNNLLLGVENVDQSSPKSLNGMKLERYEQFKEQMESLRVSVPL